MDSASRSRDDDARRLLLLGRAPGAAGLATRSFRRLGSRLARAYSACAACCCGGGVRSPANVHPAGDSLKTWLIQRLASGPLRAVLALLFLLVAEIYVIVRYGEFSTPTSRRAAASAAARMPPRGVPPPLPPPGPRPDFSAEAAAGAYDGCPPGEAEWVVEQLGGDEKVDFSTAFDGDGGKRWAAVDAAAGRAWYPTPNHFVSCWVMTPAVVSNATVEVKVAVGAAAAAAAASTAADEVVPDVKYYGEVPGISHADVRFYDGPAAVAMQGKDGKTVYRRPQRTGSEPQQLAEVYGGWARFSAAHNVTAWLAHGALLGWYWSRVALPWDDDVDLQMTYRGVEELAARFNGSLFEDRFLVDANPNFVYRHKQPRNVIDARFVDTKTGRFIDITGLASAASPRFVASHASTTLVSCKSVHAYEHTAMFPLREATFEGSPALVPHDVRAVLVSEYGERSLHREEFGQYEYDRGSRTWVRRRRGHNAAPKRYPYRH
ncbi:hypothetical protein HK405_003432 [Cladochytrium tenue]|nr:hypothetical protein HK405_003432 [Cladochytrium tenue]